jgi:predicted phage terminase large subunit-like protein
VEITEPLVAQLIIDTKCEWMVIESNNGGRQYARNIRNLTDPKWKCSISDQNQTANKETRILMNAGYIKEYFYFRDDYAPGSDYDKFMRALTSYVKLGKNAHDDAPDAITGLAEIMRYKAYAPTQPKPVYNFSWEKPKPNAGGYGEPSRVI